MMVRLSPIARRDGFYVTFVDSDREFFMSVVERDDHFFVSDPFQVDHVPVMEFTLERAVSVAQDHVMRTYG